MVDFDPGKVNKPQFDIIAGEINRQSKIVPNSIEVIGLKSDYQGKHKLELEFSVAKPLANLHLIKDNPDYKVRVEFSLPNKYSTVASDTQFKIMNLPEKLKPKEALIREIIKSSSQSVYDEINQKVQKMTEDPDDWI